MRDLAEALDGLAEDLERQRRARLQLAQDLSHELRTPLMLLQSRIEAMQDGVVPSTPRDSRPSIPRPCASGAWSGRSRAWPRRRPSRRPLRRELVAIHDLAREAHVELAPAFELRGIELVLDASPRRAEADRDAVRQIATNLSTNALK